MQKLTELCSHLRYFAPRLGRIHELRHAAMQLRHNQLGEQEQLQCQQVQECQRLPAMAEQAQQQQRVQLQQQLEQQQQQQLCSHQEKCQFEQRTLQQQHQQQQQQLHDHHWQQRLLQHQQQSQTLQLQQHQEQVQLLHELSMGTRDRYQQMRAQQQIWHLQQWEAQDRNLRQGPLSWEAEAGQLQRQQQQEQQEQLGRRQHKTKQLLEKKQEQGRGKEEKDLKQRLLVQKQQRELEMQVKHEQQMELLLQEQLRQEPAIDWASVDNAGALMEGLKPSRHDLSASVIPLEQLTTCVMCVYSVSPVAHPRFGVHVYGQDRPSSVRWSPVTGQYYCDGQYCKTKPNPRAKASSKDCPHCKLAESYNPRHAKEPPPPLDPEELAELEATRIAALEARDCERDEVAKQAVSMGDLEHGLRLTPGYISWLEAVKPEKDFRVHKDGERHLPYTLAVARRGRQTPGPGSGCAYDPGRQAICALSSCVDAAIDAAPNPDTKCPECTGECHLEFVETAGPSDLHGLPRPSGETTPPDQQLMGALSVGGLSVEHLVGGLAGLSLDQAAVVHKLALQFAQQHMQPQQPPPLERSGELPPPGGPLGFRQYDANKVLWRRRAHGVCNNPACAGRVPWDPAADFVVDFGQYAMGYELGHQYTQMLFGTYVPREALRPEMFGAGPTGVNWAAFVGFMNQAYIKAQYFRDICRG